MRHCPKKAISLEAAQLLSTPFTWGQTGLGNVIFRYVATETGPQLQWWYDPQDGAWVDTPHDVELQIINSGISLYVPEADDANH